jgi:acetyl esterase/lipase
MASERSTTFKMARMSEGLVFALDYRLAPQSPFPAGLVDCILAYRYLIDPPPGSLHEPIDPKRIVVAGGSAGVPFQFKCDSSPGGTGVRVDVIFSTFT